jgi:hypothetical protein
MSRLQDAEQRQHETERGGAGEPRSAAEQKCQSRPSAMPGAAKASSIEPATKLVGNKTHAESDERAKGSTPNGLATRTKPATRPSATQNAPVTLSIKYLLGSHAIRREIIAVGASGRDA